MADKSQAPLSVVVLGASGDLARRKIFPALFALDSQGLLPKETRFFGLSRTSYEDATFRQKISENLTCRYVPESRCQDRMEDFLSRCFYHPGQYDQAESFIELYGKMRALEGDKHARRLFFMAVPPFLFYDVAQAIGAAGLVACGDEGAVWSRAVIEKPFGRDRASSDELVQSMGHIFTESQTYRIDHYLGKEMIQNLMALRFANRIFEPLWTCDHIESVEILFKEPFGTEGRAGYFDQYGIIRDVMQNHLLQILALAAMDHPREFDAEGIRDAKVAFLKTVDILGTDNVLVGQYGPGERDGRKLAGYLEEEGVPEDSITPTFATAVLRSRHPRWQGVPFVMTAGKALDERLAELRIRFRPVENPLVDKGGCPLCPNMLTVRVQPDSGIFLHILNKVPGQALELAGRDLNLDYQEAFQEVVLPEAYESLLLDVVEGDKSLFIRSDELEVAWDIFTPLLQQLEQQRVKPYRYAYGSTGPAELSHWMEQHGH